MVYGEFEIISPHLDKFLLPMRKNAVQLYKVEVGCQQFDICQDQQNLSNIFLYEIYDDAAAFETHKASSRYHEFNRAINGMVMEKSVRFLHLVSHQC